MEMQAIRQIDIRATTAGVDAASMQLKALAAAHGSVAVASDKASTSTLSVERQMKSLQMTLDPAFRSATLMAEAQNKLNLAQQQGVISLMRYNELMDMAKAKYSSGGGFNPFAMLGDARTYLKGLGIYAAFDMIMKIHSAIDGVVQGASGLVHVSDTIGITTKNLQELQFAGSQFQISADTMNQALERFSKGLGQAATGAGPLYQILQANHVVLSGDLKKDLLTYADLVRGATNEEQKNLLVTTAFGKNSAELGDLFNHGAAGIQAFADRAEQVGAVVTDDQLHKVDELNKKWSEAAQTFGTIFKSAIMDVVLQFSALQDSITGFFAWLEAHKLTGAAAAAYATQLKLLLNPGGTITDLIFQGGSAAVGALNGPAANPSAGSMMTPDQKLRLQAEASVRQQLTGSSAPGSVSGPGGVGSYVPGGFGERYGDKPTVVPDTGAAAAAKKIQDEINSLQKATDALRAQNEAFNKGVGPAAAYQKEQELIAAAAEANVKLTPKQTEQIHQLATAYGDLVRKQAEMKALGDAQFQGQTQFLSSVNQQVAQTLHSIYGDDWQSQMNGAIASQIRLNTEFATARQLSGDFAKTFIDDLLQGKTAMDSLTDALKNLAGKLLDMAENAALNALFRNLSGLGGGAGGGSGIVSGLLGFLGVPQAHTGMVVGMESQQTRFVNPMMFAGAPRYDVGGIAGLKPGEFPIIAHFGEEILRRNDPRHRLNGGGGFGTVSIGGATINIMGDASESTLKLIEQSLKSHDQQQAPKIASLVRDSISKNSAAQNRLQLAAGG